MLLSWFFRLAFRNLNLKNKATLAVIFLMIVPAFNVYTYVAYAIVQDINVRYIHDSSTLGDVVVFYGFNYSVGERWDIIFNVTDVVRSVVGVEWAVAPRSIYYLPHNGSLYWYRFLWCNVSNPVFPKPEYVVEGKFFSSNAENAVLLDRQAFLYFKSIGRISGVGDVLGFTFRHVFWNNDSEIIASFSYVVKGVVSSPAMDALGSSITERNGFAGYIILPVNTFLKFFYVLYEKFWSRGIYDVLTPDSAIVVRVKSGYNVDAVAKEIKRVVSERFPNGEVLVYIPERTWQRTVEKEFREMVTYLVFSFTLIAGILFWDVGARKRLILLLRVIGWKRKHILILFIFRYAILAVLGSLIAAFVTAGIYVLFGVSFAKILLVLVKYYFLAVAVVYVLFTLVFSVPALLRVYGLDLEKVLR